MERTSCKLRAVTELQLLYTNSVVDLEQELNSIPRPALVNAFVLTGISSGSGPMSGLPLHPTRDLRASLGHSHSSYSPFGGRVKWERRAAVTYQSTRYVPRNPLPSNPTTEVALGLPGSSNFVYILFVFLIRPRVA